MVSISNMNNKVKVLIFLICVVVLISTVNTTYSRYVSATNGTVTTDLARWQIFVNSQNITENYGTSMTFTPTIEQNENVAANKIAPSSKGYFDIAINPVNVDVSFTYDIGFGVPENSLITDIRVTDYAIIEGTEITEETVFNKISLPVGNSIKNTLFYSNIEENFSFKPFIIRAYFAWVDDETGNMSDETDGEIGNMIANGDELNFNLNVNINFKQYTGIEDEPGDDVNNSDPEQEPTTEPEPEPEPEPDSEPESGENGTDPSNPE